MPRRRLPVAGGSRATPGMRRVVRRGVALAAPELAHSVHVEVCAASSPAASTSSSSTTATRLSPVGRTRTAPRATATRVGSLAFAFASCQTWDDGYYSAYRRMAEEDLDFVVHLGDYVYEYGVDEHGGFRNARCPTSSAPRRVTLERYRLQYALYKSDPDLQRAHQLFPWVVTWDDHEVQNDYAGLAPEGGEPNPAFTARRAAAYQAFYEHIPLRAGGAAARRRAAPLPAADVGRPGASSACSTRASTAPTSRAATASSRAAPRRSTRRSRCSAASRSAGCTTGSSDSRRALERDRPAGDDGPARPRPRRPADLLARRLGRLPGRAPADHRPPRRRPRPQPGRDHRRLALDVRQRHQARTSRTRTRRRSRPSSSAPRSRRTATSPSTARTTAR